MTMRLSVVHRLLLLVTATRASVPRLFPAAKQERYDPQTSLLRTVLARPSLFASGALHGEDEDDDDNPILQAAKKRFLQYLHQLPDYAQDFPVNPNQQQLSPIKSIKLVVREKNVTYTHVPPNVDESYQIQIDADSGDTTKSTSTSTSDTGIRVEAATVFGIVRGLESLAQLVEFGWIDKKDAVFIIHNTPLFIADKPTFPYRGLMIDTARHYLPLDLILDNLDAMTMNKMNVMHWHMTDDQSWPFQSTTYPEISQQGAYDPQHNIYSHDDVQKVLDAALLRGIRIIPEFDLPGHAAALEKSHPELVSQCAPPGQHSFSSPLDPTLPHTYEVVENIYKEVATLFPDPFVHVGGDEVRLDCWKQSANIQQWAKAHGDMTDKELLNYFESILTDIVASNGKTPIAWQELLNEGVDLPRGTIVDVWKGFDKDTIVNATKRGYHVVISGCWYLDYLSQSWKDYYNCDPLHFNGTKAQKSLVLGGHGSMWGERVDSTDFTSRVWPRASSVAERLWSGNDNLKVLKQTVYDRLTRFRCFMLQRGVSAAPIGPGTCGRQRQTLPSSEGAWLRSSRQRKADA